ncbi:MmcQ/YjbR family DNA-binding protein [Sulfurimonas sp.]|uniref:MmcQ/YjbR family DNA-binding protein n=1 Tax=Sulfurimonas sp. TaxID=2022749 RepID=UPI003569C442
MTLEKLEKLLISKNASTKEFPFDDKTMVFKVMNKMFALVSIEESPLRINLKSLPQDAVGYRDIYECVTPGYHMNKKHWNSVILDGTMKDDVLKQMIYESYDLVVSKLTKKDKAQLLLKV